MESWLPWLADDDRVLPDLLPAGARIVLVEPRRIRDRAAELNDEEAALAGALAVTWGVVEGAHDGGVSDDAHTAFPRLHVDYERLLARCRAPVLSMVPVAEGPSMPTVAAHGWDPVLGDRIRLAAELGALVRDGYSVTLCADGAGSAQRLADVLAEEGLSVPVVTDSDDDSEVARPGVRVAVASLDSGFVCAGAHVAVLAESDLTGRRRPHRRARARARPTDGFFDDLAVGDYVVHRQHGVARFAGMVTRTVNGASRDYLLLEYRGADKLYLPSDQIEAITPYSGGEAPSLNRLGGSEWQRTRAKARAAVHEVAQELVELYRKRLHMSGYAFAPDTPWQLELEDAFPFVDTADQRRAVEDVKADMEAETPMDRLVCGDVGFGKTEVAVRAAFKCVQQGKQAAVLVPTTLLAQPARPNIRRSLLGVSRACRDAVALSDPGRGAHRAGRPGRRHRRRGGGHAPSPRRRRHLQGPGPARGGRGAALRREPQRGHQGHHRRRRRADVDGQPHPPHLGDGPYRHPRPLAHQHPAGGTPAHPHLRRRVRGARRGGGAAPRAAARGPGLLSCTTGCTTSRLSRQRLRQLVPEARVAVAHGQMDEGTLGAGRARLLGEALRRARVHHHHRVGHRYAHGEHPCRRPRRSARPRPAAPAARAGGAIRAQRAYAYLLHPADRVLTEAAYERLRTIGEHTELGSGFKIAMRDLEIRGAGNLLGRDQSGHIAAVGYDLYVQLVAEAVADLKGEPRRPPVEVTIDVPCDAHLPADYVAREDLRLEAYRRLASVTLDTEVDDIKAEWIDRFGPLPAAAEGLLAVARLRAECLRVGAREISATPARPGQGVGPVTRRGLIARVSPLALAASARVRLRRLRPEATFKEDLGRLIVPLDPGEDPVAALTELLGSLVPPQDQ